MSAPINDGGPAFPVADTVHSTGQVQYGVNGMTLRDYFAGQALAGMLINYTTQKFGFCELTCAKGAYEFADAMLSARKEATK
jgi:hypothetical protein